VDSSNQKREIWAIIAMICGGGIAATLNVLSIGGTLFLSSIMLPVIIALIAGRRPLLYGVAANVVQWIWIVPVQLVAFHGHLSFGANDLGVAFLVLGIMIVAAIVPCGILELVWRKYK
jgi:hypothetical protein